MRIRPKEEAEPTCSVPGKRIKSEPTANPPGEGRKHLPGSHPYFLDPNADNALLMNMEIISEQQPEWLRRQIMSDLRRRHDPPDSPMTSRLANILFSRSYRLKIRDAKELFGAQNMGQVVEWCLDEGRSSHPPATG